MTDSIRRYNGDLNTVVLSRDNDLYAEQSKTFIQLVMGSKCSHNHTPVKLGSIRLLLEKICLFIKPPYLRYSGAYELDKYQ